jgi:HAMP domain-containing protein
MRLIGPLVGLASRLMRPFVALVSHTPARVQFKLLAAFLAIAMLLIIVGAVGLHVLSGVHERAEDLVKLQRKIEAYRQVQHDTTTQLYSVASALLSADERTLSSTLRQLDQLGHDVDRLQFAAKDEVELLSRFRQDYDRFIDVATRVIDMIRSGRAAEARDLQAAQATPLADRLERLTNQLVNKAEADMVAGIEASTQAYWNAQFIVIAFALASIALALGLGYAISWSLIGPVKEIETRLNQLAAGDFTQRIHVSNRDELGALAANVNRMCNELGRLYQQIETASQHKSQFLASMSHELRTPLNAIIGLTEMMVTNAARFGTEKALEPLRRVNAAGTHLLGLINEVLDLSKIEAGKLELNPEQVDLARLIDEVIGTAGQLAEKNKNRLVVDCGENVGPVTADPMRLKQVLLNLLSNSCKFTNEGRSRAQGAQGDGRARLDRAGGCGHRHRHDSRAAGQTIPGVHPGRFPDLAALWRDRTRSCALAQARADDGWRRDRSERAGQRFGIHAATAGWCSSMTRAHSELLRRSRPHDRFGHPERTWPDHLVMSQKCQNRI